MRAPVRIRAMRDPAAVVLCACVGTSLLARQWTVQAVAT
jgi:hypothetical protein